MKILITGGAGFIGNHLSRHFVKNNDEVYVIDNLSTGNKNNIKDLLNNDNFHFFQSDICEFDYSKLSGFDIVYDLASPASPKLFEKLSLEILKVNSVGLIKLLKFFKNSQSKVFVFASTSEVYGDPKVDPQPETYFGNVNTLGARACYDEGKRFAEALIMSYLKKFDLDLRIARIFNTYGPLMDKDDGRVISNFINQAISNKSMTIYGNGKQTRSCCYISDMIDALYSLGTKPGLKGEVINIGNPEEKTVLEIAEIIKKLTSSKSNTVFNPLPEDDPKIRCPNIKKAKKLLGWSPKINLEQGLKLTIKYFKNL